MDVAIAQARLERMVAASTEPVLDAAAIADILGLAARPDYMGNDPRNIPAVAVRASSTLYAINDIVRQDLTTERWWICEIPGTTRSTAPVWPVMTYVPGPSDITVVDGPVIWRDAGSRWQPTYDLNAAAMHGWEQKAAAVAHRFNFAADSNQFNVSQIHAMCLTMADRYKARSPQTIRVTF